MLHTHAPAWFAAIAGATLAAIAGIVALVATAGISGSMVPASAAGVAFAATVFVAGLRSGGVRSRLASASPALRIVCSVGALLLVAQLAFAAAFTIHPTLTRWEPRPWHPQRSNHSCVSAYWVACRAVTQTPAIYDEALYSLPQPNPTAPRRARALGPFLIDNYEYPPAFLVLPRAIAAVTADFWGFRRVWFALMLAVTAVGIVAVARRLDTASEGRAMWLAPYVLAAPAMIMTFLMGNVQLAIIAAAILAMLAFERRRYAAGGALMAYVTLSKLFPGVLLLYLLLRRDWRAVAWTAAWGVVLLLITLADFGAAPYLAFARELPHLLGGEAFSALRNPTSFAVNESVPGLPLKLALLGVPGMGFAVSKALGWAYTVVVLAVTVRLALRPARHELEPLAWLVVLILASLRSPFVATYAPFPSLWLATLVAAIAWGRPLGAAAVALWLVLAFTFGAGGASPQVNAVWSSVHTLAAFALVVLACRQMAPATVQVPSPGRSGALASP